MNEEKLRAALETFVSKRIKAVKKALVTSVDMVNYSFDCVPIDE